MKASELLLDYDLYPRERIEPFNVNQMIEALTAGRELPPIIVDRKSLRVIDGFHRVKAYQRLHGPDAEIPPSHTLGYLRLKFIPCLASPSPT